MLSPRLNTPLKFLVIPKFEPHSSDIINDIADPALLSNTSAAPVQHNNVKNLLMLKNQIFNFISDL